VKRDMSVPYVKDPVCGHTFSEGAAAAEYRHKGKTYYFCTPSCRDEFAANPRKYLDKRGRWRQISHTNTHQHRQFGVDRFSTHR